MSSSITRLTAASFILMGAMLGAVPAEAIGISSGSAGGTTNTGGTISTGASGGSVGTAINVGAESPTASTSAGTTPNPGTIGDSPIAATSPLRSDTRTPLRSDSGHNSLNTTPASEIDNGGAQHREKVRNSVPVHQTQNIDETGRVTTTTNR